MKSNINIVSNVYIRENNIIAKDINFIKNVSGYLALCNLNKKLIGKEELLSEPQQNIVYYGERCSKSKDNEITHGPSLVNGELVWSNRCESTKCNLYKECVNEKSFYKLERNKCTELNVIEVSENNNINYASLGIFGDEDKISEKYLNVTIKDIEEDRLVDFREDYSVNIKSSDFKEIEDHNIIIKSEFNSKIIVNAGPGTGKTYSVIERLIYILNNESIDADTIVVLCYTRSARDTIIERISEAINSNKLPVEANEITVNTFDSFASQYLQITETDLDGLDYDGRIKLFNNKIEKEFFNGLNYLIIDEIQDLVNERALMVLSLLKVIDCGFLLLGDKCQAIYDYDCEGELSINSVKFYEMLFDTLKDNILKYELIENKRQSKDLAKQSMEIRRVLLSDKLEDQPKKVSELMKAIKITPNQIENYSPLIDREDKEAILCRNNGEVEYVSSLLHEKGIRHKLISGKKNTLNRVLGDVFWDFTERKIGKDKFIERYVYRIEDNLEKADILFNELNKISNSKQNEIDLDNLVNSLKNNNEISDLLLNIEEDNLTVSTIHKAKGREFDKVYLLETSEIVSAEECRVNYVAITRPKKEIEIITKKYKNQWFFKKDRNDRLIKTALKPYRRKSSYCTNILIGLDSDIDTSSFIDKEKDYIKIQEYISKNININDSIEIFRDIENDNIYKLIHNDFVIGVLKSDIKNDFWASIKSTSDRRNIPRRLYNIFVTNIITLVENKYNEDIPNLFKESKFWLGIEIRGFARVEY